MADLDAWVGFFGAQVAGSSALLGLLFVSISLNLDKVLAERTLPDRALVAMVLLLAIILSSSLALLPGQSDWALGLELLLIGAAVSIGGGFFELRILTSRNVTGPFPVMNLVLFGLASLPILAGGWMLMSGSPAGLYWVAGGILVSLTKAVLDAWVLLVEINR